MTNCMCIAVDFDGTLTTDEGPPYWEDPYDERPDHEMIELVNELYNEGHVIHVWTARKETARPVTNYWLDEWGVKRHALVMAKHSADAFIDDRAVHVDRAKRMGRTGIERALRDGLSVTVD